MRKNVRKAYQFWLLGKAKRVAPSVWTDGNIIYSYRTPIVVRKENGDIGFNYHKYSRTTSTQQHSLLLLLKQDGLESYVRSI